MLGLFLASAVVVAVPLALAGVATRLERGSAERVRQRQQAPCLAAELPWWVIEEDGSVIGVDLRYSFVLSLVGVDVDCMSTEDLDHLQQQIHAMLISLPAGTRLQYIHINDHDNGEVVARYAAQVTSVLPCAARVQAARLEKLANSPRLRRSRLYLCVTLPCETSAVLSRMSGARTFEAVSEVEHESDLVKLENLARQMAGALGSASVECRQLIRDEVRALAYGFLNPTRCRHVPVAPGEDLAGAPQQSMREKLCLSGLQEGKDSLEIDGRLVRVLTLRGLPTLTDSELLEGLTVGLPLLVSGASDARGDRRPEVARQFKAQA